MSMNNVSAWRGPCEVLREINDIVQYDKELNRTIRYKLAEVEQMAKNMSIELVKHVPDYYKRWEQISSSQLVLRTKRRSDPGYLFDKI